MLSRDSDVQSDRNILGLGLGLTVVTTKMLSRDRRVSRSDVQTDRNIVVAAPTASTRNIIE